MKKEALCKKNYIKKIIEMDYHKSVRRLRKNLNKTKAFFYLKFVSNKNKI